MEIEYDIYDNLPKNDINTCDAIEKLQEQNKQQLDFINSLQADIDKLCAKILDMKQTEKHLTCNISELYKTAKAEIDRKDRLIIDLRSQLEKVKSEKKSLSMKRQRSPNSRRFNVNPTNLPGSKKFKTDLQDDINQSRSGGNRSRSHSSEKFRKSYCDGSGERGRKGVDRQSHGYKAVRDYNHRRYSPTNEKEDEKSKKAGSIKEKRDINTEKHNKWLFDNENKGIKVVNEECKQGKNSTNESVGYGELINRKRNEDSTNEKKHKWQSTVLGNSQKLYATQAEEKNVQKDKEPYEYFKVNNGKFATTRI